MRYREQINDNEYSKARTELTSEITRLRENLNETGERADKWLELADNTFEFATHARHNFLNGDLQTKKQILMNLGQNPVIKDGQLTLELYKWFQPIADGNPELVSDYEKVRTQSYASAKEKEAALATINAKWLHGQDSNL